jgi:hypothetical protein
MRVRFDRFVERLIALGNPSHEDLAALVAGADLAMCLETETDDFGAAAPDVDPAASFAERVAALTDEAFEAAARLVQDEEWSAGDARKRDLTAEEALRHAVSEYAFDPEIHGAVAAALLSCPPATDPTIASEFV